MKPTRRDLVVIGVLSVVTLGLYNIWLLWRWSRELNAFFGKERIPSWMVLLLGILTLGVSGCVFEALYALDLEKEAQARRLDAPEVESARTIVGLNIAAFVLTITGVGWIIAFPIGVAATILMGRAINRVADVVDAQGLARATSAAPYENAPTA